MPLFRNKRGTLEESLTTTVIIKTMDELKKHIWIDYEIWRGAIRKDGTPLEDFDIKIEPYYGECDYRCGWYTQIVSINAEDKNRFDTIGFLSEPLDDYKE
jgi:hypothetical protein